MYSLRLSLVCSNCSLATESPYPLACCGHFDGELQFCLIRSSSAVLLGSSPPGVGRCLTLKPSSNGVSCWLTPQQQPRFSHSRSSVHHPSPVAIRLRFHVAFLSPRHYHHLPASFPVSSAANACPRNAALISANIDTSLLRAVILRVSAWATC